jgi:excisionase family DNA binding protein
LAEAAQLLQVSSMTVLRLIQRKLLSAQQPCPGAPWIIRRSNLDSPAVKRALTLRLSDDPLTPNQNQHSLDFQ